MTITAFSIPNRLIIEITDAISVFHFSEFGDFNSINQPVRRPIAKKSVVNIGFSVIFITELCCSGLRDGLIFSLIVLIYWGAGN